MPKINQQIVRTVEAALAAAHPDRYPFEDQDILIARIIWTRYLCPTAWTQINREWNWTGGWLHHVGRDRRNQKELKRLYDSGVRTVDGYTIYGGKSEPYLERWDKDFVFEVWQDMKSIPALGGILVEPKNPHTGE